MKRYLIGTFAVIAAVVCFSFTKDSNKVLGCSATDQYVWFEVDPSFNLDCNQYPNVIQSQVLLTGHTAPSNNPLTDLAAAGYRLQQSGAEITFGCEATTKLCAVAYNISDVTTTKFEKVEIPVGSGQFFWRPKTGANRPVPFCAICKP